MDTNTITLTRKQGIGHCGLCGDKFTVVVHTGPRAGSILHGVFGHTIGRLCVRCWRGFLASPEATPLLEEG